MESTLSRSAERKLLKVRRLLKRKKPNFLRVDTKKRKKLEEVWRKPRGKGKQRRRRSSTIPLPDVGYRSPRKVRGLHPSGFKEILVHNVKDLENLNPKEHVLKIASDVGKRKKVEIVRKAVELGLRIVNLKNPEKFLEEVRKEIESRKLAKKIKEGEVEKKEEVGKGKVEAEKEEGKGKVMEKEESKEEAKEKGVGDEKA